jgi:osmotically-inducible protein OsmY
LFLAPKRRGDTLHGGRSAAVADAALDASRAAQRTLQWIWSYASRSRDLTDIAPDERAALRIRAELERRGIWAPRLDVTLIDGTAYLRGREADPGRAETIVNVAHTVPGVFHVVDEIRRG